MKNLELKIRIIRKFGTQTDFARVVGVREDKLSRLINGRVYPTEWEKEIIAQKLGATPQELFFS